MAILSKFPGGSSGNSGTDLNFSIVGGTTQPQNPEENTIWVNTDVEITGWVFGATEPENPIEGMVWIKTGPNSDNSFNVIKEEVINVYPIKVSQYVSNSWQDKIANIYQSNEWLDIDSRYLLLYNGSIAPWNGTTPVSYSDGILRTVTDGNCAAVIVFADPIDVTPYSILTFRLKQTAVLTNDYKTVFGISTSSSIPDVAYASNKKLLATYMTCNNSTDYVTYQLPITDFSGEYYIRTSSIATVEIDMILLQ